MFLSFCGWGYKISFSKIPFGLLMVYTFFRRSKIFKMGIGEVVRRMTVVVGWMTGGQEVFIPSWPLPGWG